MGSVIRRTRYGHVLMLSLFVLQGCTDVAHNESSALKVTGHIEGVETHVSALTPGLISSIAINEGDRLKSGQLIAQIDPQELLIKLKASDDAIKAAQDEETQLQKLVNLLQVQIHKGLPQKPSANSDGGKVSLKGPKASASTQGLSALDSAPDAQSQVSAKILRTRQDALQQEYRAQQATLTEAQNSQRESLEQALKAQRSALDQAFQSKKSALAEVKKAKSKGGIISKIWPFDLAPKAKNKALEEIFRTKESALQEGYDSKLKALGEVETAQRKELDEVFKAKRSALEAAFAAKQAALEQTSLATAAGMSAASAQASQMRDAVSQMRASFANASSAPGSGLASSMKMMQSASLKLQLEDARAKLLAVRIQIVQAKGGLAELEQRIGTLRITSPTNGICSAKNFEPGEIYIPGQPLITIVDPNSLYLRAFVPELHISEIRLGQTAHVYLDTPGQAPFLEAKVSAIDPQPSYTPENVAFKNERVRQVFGIKLAIKNVGESAKPGMPAEAEILPGGQGGVAVRERSQDSGSF